MRSHLEQILKNNDIQWQFVSIFAPPFNHHQYPPISRLTARLVNFIQCLFNSEQLAVLRDNGRLRSMWPEDTPMAMLQDIARVFLQLRTLVLQDEQIQQLYQYADVPSKRQRNI